MIQLSKLIEYFKNMFNTKSKKKWIENAVILAIIGVIVIIAGGTLFGGSKKAETSTPQTVASSNVSSNLSSSDNYEIESEIEKILTQIAGAGKVNVMITYYSGKEIVPITNTKKTENETMEKDTGGGTRNVTESDLQSDVVYEEGQDGTKKAIVAKEILPPVKGVVIVADGAGEIDVKDNLVNAVQVLVDIPIYKIKVFQRNK